MAQAIVEYGKPYMLAHISLDAVIEALPEDGLVYDPERILVALMLAGRLREAQEFIERELAKIPEDVDPRNEWAVKLPEICSPVPSGVSPALLVSQEALWRFSLASSRSSAERPGSVIGAGDESGRN